MKKSGKAYTVVSFIVIILGFFMALLDTTIVNISLPKMAAYFNTNVQQISWVVNSYNIAFIVLMITASRLADQFGRKRLFLLGILAFTITSCLVGLSTSLELVILFRVLQGLSAAIIVPVTVPLIIDIVSIKKLGMVIGVWGAVGGLAAACGPALGGILTQTFNWQAVFFVNLPFGIIALILSAVLLNESYDNTASRYIDFPGMIAISVSLFTVTLGLLQAPEKGWTSSYILVLLAVSIVSLIVFIFIEFRSKEPMLPLWLMKIRSFSAASITLVFGTAGLMAGSFLVAFYLIRVMEMSQINAGMTLIIMPISMMVFSVIAGPVSHKIGCRPFGVLGIGLISLSVFLFGFIGEDASRFDVMWRLIIMGAGLGMTIAPVMGAAIKNAPVEKVGIASGITNLARTLGMVVGVAILATLLGNNSNHELIKIREEAIMTINSNTVLSSEIKEDVTTIIKSIEDLDSNESIHIDQKYAVFNQKDNTLMTEQKEELRKVFLKVKDDMENSRYGSFTKTFRYFSIMLVFGLAFAVFSDKTGKEKEKTA
jgi:EmrB/QacA subfamily drug resistance transporter